jgi:hypothetical protein
VIADVAQDDLFDKPQEAAAGAPPAPRPHACRCQMCYPENPAPTYTETFRHECEVRYVANLPSDDRRTAYLEEVDKCRGQAAYFRLRRDAWQLMQMAGSA